MSASTFVINLYLSHFWLVVDRHKLTVFYLKSFDMDSVQVGKAVFGKEIHTTLGIEPRTNSNPGRYGNPYSVCWFKKKLVAIRHYIQVR